MATDRIDQRFFEYARTRDVGLRNQLVLDNRGLAIAFARRYRDRGVPSEDLDQIALEALVRSVDRFEPERGLRFSTFAARTIEGDLKQYFRDRTWDVRVPRRTRQLVGTIRSAADKLSQDLGRTPTPAEIAAELDLDLAEVTLALEASGAYRAERIDTTDRPEVASASQDFDRVDASVVAPALLETLTPDERRVVELRFFGSLSQSQIADQVGVSQMQISRVLKRALTKLRAVAESG